MYMLIQNRLASMWELKNCYSLEEALKLFAILQMQIDVQSGKRAEIERR